MRTDQFLSQWCLAHIHPNSDTHSRPRSRSRGGLATVATSCTVTSTILRVCVCSLKVVFSVSSIRDPTPSRRRITNDKRGGRFPPTLFPSSSPTHKSAWHGVKSPIANPKAQDHPRSHSGKQGAFQLTLTMRHQHTGRQLSS